MVAKHPVVLASASPRRRELLLRLFPNFEVVDSGVPEHLPETGDPERVAKRLARAKALGVAVERRDAIVIGADTVVAVGERLLAKPETPSDAASMLRLLSGRDHTVTTAVAILYPHGERTEAYVFADTAQVRFRPLDEEEIQAYVATGEPMDKAGAYAIQGGAASFIESLEGDMDTVIGLPVARLREALSQLSLACDLTE
jgi:septum formation protein